MVRLVIITCVALATLFGVMETQSSKAQSDMKMVVQPYESYGLVGKMRLSAAYFVNPSLAKQADVGYFVALTDLDQNELVAVDRLIAEGSAAPSIMISDGKFYKVIEPEAALDLAKSSSNAGVILDQRNVEGLKGEPVVSWGGLITADADEVYGEGHMGEGHMGEGRMKEADKPHAPSGDIAE